MSVSAQGSPQPRLGDTAWALPGVVRVGVPGAGLRRVAVAGTAGYGYTEALTPRDAAHHRVVGTAAVAVAPTSALEVALRLDGRYDRHPDDGDGAHGGAVGDPRLLARLGGALGGNFRAGGELGVWLPGKDAPSVAFDATTIDLKLLGAWMPPSGPTVGLMAGLRLDRSGSAAPDPAQLRFGDRLALGLSDFNAVLLGLGVAVPVGTATEILGEVSADLLVGAGAPSLSKSPLRVTAGARQHLNGSLALELLAEASPSGRPSLGPTAPLVPVEPRISVTAGLRYQLPFDTPREAVAATRTPPAAVPKPVSTTATPTPTSVQVTVTGADGTAIAGASVEIRVGEWSRAAPRAEDGSYRVEGVPAGKATIVVSADAFVSAEQSAQVEAGRAVAVRLQLSPVPPSGQLRGLVRSFGGRGLGASIRVEPLGTEAKADAQGAFTLDVPPGDYEIVIRAERFKEQRRKVHVDQNGVTVLNAELFEAK